jgi:NADP-dependent 3-hydroxy acid dehydrogenase YdfG
VNNVGGMIASDVLKSTDKQWDDSWQLNVMSGVRLSRSYLPGMRARNWGASSSSPARAACGFPPKASPTAR